VILLNLLSNACKFTKEGEVKLRAPPSWEVAPHRHGRRTVTVNACEVEAGKDRVMHLAINSGTDLALFNAWLTFINEKG
jgi:anaerobic selenocysteine-containing dehydrogenase